MATSTTISLKEFNLQEALAGSTLAFSSNGTTGGVVERYVLDFGLNNKSSEKEKYKGRVGNTTYYFNSSGEESSGNSLNKLFIVSADIAITEGTVATKGGEGSSENIGIDILQPREQFAIAALQGILYNIKEPLLLDNGKISIIADMAFRIAQSMMNTAADYRAATQSGSPESVDVDINNVTSTTDKILYNMSKDINKISNTLGNSARVQKVDISAASITVPTNVNNTVSTYVTNMPSVPTEPVSVTGTVSVDNFPKS